MEIDFGECQNATFVAIQFSILVPDEVIDKVQEETKRSALQTENHLELDVEKAEVEMKTQLLSKGSTKLMSKGFARSAVQILFKVLPVFGQDSSKFKQDS